MGYSNLSSEAMVEVSAEWLDPGRSRPKLEALESIAGILPRLKQAHDALFQAQSFNLASDKKLKSLGADLATEDRKHDRKARGVYKVLEAYSELADDEESAALFLGTRDELFPDGLRIINASYVNEA